MEKLSQLRKKIDQADRQIVAALNERCRIARLIGLYKKEKEFPVLDVSREDALLDKICQLNDGDIPEASLLKIYREILAISRKIQEEL